MTIKDEVVNVHMRNEPTLLYYRIVIVAQPSCAKPLTKKQVYDD